MVRCALSLFDAFFTTVRDLYRPDKRPPRYLPHIADHFHQANSLVAVLVQYRPTMLLNRRIVYQCRAVWSLGIDAFMSQVLFTVDIDVCTITTHVVVMETVAPGEYFTHYCYLRNFGQCGSLYGGIWYGTEALPSVRYSSYVNCGTGG